jgi:prevent-host-death family protein
MTEHIKAGKFKAQCLKIMDRVKKTRKRIVITKRNKPVAQLVPIEEKEISLFGAMKGSIHIIGDIVAPIGEDWDADR